MTEQNSTRIRASDAEREQVVSVLREAMIEGRLTLDEGAERITGTYATTYRDELPAFTADLPTEPPRTRTGPSRRVPAGRRRPSGSPAGLIVLLAVAAGGWALAGGPIWPAVVLAILAIMVAKGGGCRRISRPVPADRVADRV